MAHAGQELHGPDGFLLRLIRVDDDVLQMEATYAGTGAKPPEHLHPNQLERFEVLEGRVDTIIDGVERRYEQGEAFEVGPGVPHRMGSDLRTRLRWEVTPALRSAEFFETLYGGTAGATFLEDFAAEFRLTGR